MKIFNFLSKNAGLFATMVLGVLAAALGADSLFAMAEVVTASTTGPAVTNDDKGLATQVDGAATSTHATKTDFEDEDIDQKVALFRPFNFPLEYDIVMNAQNVKVKSYHPIHYRSGSNPLEAVCTTFGTATRPTTRNTDDNGTAYAGEWVVTVSAGTGLENLKEYTTAYTSDANGYDPTGTTVDGDLAVFVLKNDGTSVKLLVLNGPSTAPSYSNLTFKTGATAGSESQMLVDPENYQPVPKEVYLQKKLSNIVFTKDWIEQAKKVPFIEKDIRNNALYNFKRKNARTHWLGVKKRILINVEAGKIGEEYVYFEEGVLRQIPLFYSLAGGKVDYADLNAINKLQFAKNSVSNSARAYCGQNFIENLLNMDMTIHKEIKFEAVTEAGMTFSRWKNNFGQIDFVHDPTLDDIGYEDFCVVVDIANAVRYVKRDEQTETIDMSKGSGEIREAERDIFSIIDCIALKGYNAVLVGPAAKMGAVSKLGSISTYGTSAATLPQTPAEGDIVYLTASATASSATGGLTFAKGSVVQFKDGKWVEYDGQLTA